MNSDPLFGPEPPTLSRLNALLSAGYRIDHATSRKVGNVIWLDHPAERRVAEKTLILSSCGLVVGNCVSNPGGEQLRIAPDDESNFASFIAKVPFPTLRERTADARAIVVGCSVFLVIAVTVGFVIKEVLAWLGWK